MKAAFPRCRPSRARRPLLRAGLLAMLGAAALGAFMAAPSAVEPPGASAARAEPRPGLELRRDIAYAGPEGPRLDAYFRPRSGAPAVLLVHGGAWQFGDKRRLNRVAVALARRGFAVFNVNYTLAAQGRPGFPAQPAELRAAVRWIRRNAGRLGVDARRIGALGSSAGGNLAALLATGGDGPLGAGHRIRAAVTWSAPLSLAELHGRGALGRAVEVYLGCSGEPCGERLREASPAAHVSTGDPALFMINSSDELVPAGQARQMADRLRRLGVPHRLRIVDGGLHGVELAPRMLRPAMAFLRRELGRPRAARR